jgi:D-glycero-D-manno-heptose 1,7-bisphosphate phosphatase
MRKNGNATRATRKSAGRLGPKGKLGDENGLSIDPAAAAFPAALLSPPAYPPLQSRRDSLILRSVMTTSAVFWDRDNTLIEDPGYLSDPEQVKLMPGAAQAIRRLTEAGFENIIVTNQSAIARGLLDEPTLERIHARLRELLAAQGAEIDAIYYCPYLEGPEAVVEEYRLESDLRKPRPGMLAKASLERKIDLAGSWMIGNSLSDTQAGRAAGCRTILITEGSESGRDRSVDFTAKSLEEAVEIVLKHTVAATSEVKTEAGTKSADAVDKTLQEILTFLRSVDRRNQAEDFSLGRLLGMVLQMLAITALVWAVFGMLRGDAYGAQIVRFLFTIALQALALTTFLVSSRR